MKNTLNNKIDISELSKDDMEKLVNTYLKLRVSFSKKIKPLKNYILKTIHKNRYSLEHITESFFDGISIKHEGKLDYEEPVIYVFNHGTPNDIMNASEIIGENQAYTLIATDCLNIKEKLLFKVLGMIPVDRTDNTKVSQKLSMNLMLRYLVNGSNVIIFPEATWNLPEIKEILTPDDAWYYACQVVKQNKMMLPLYWGAVELAQKTGYKIVPVISHRMDNGDYKFIVREGIKINHHQDKGMASKLLETIMSESYCYLIYNDYLSKIHKRDDFNPEEELKRRLEPELGFQFNDKKEKAFIRKEKYYYDAYMAKHSLVNPEDVAGLYHSSGLRLTKEIKNGYK